MNVCENYCADFRAACADDYFCYNGDQLAEYLTDVINGKVDDNKDYKVFQCSGTYTCKRVGDSILSKPLVWLFSRRYFSQEIQKGHMRQFSYISYIINRI